MSNKNNIFYRINHKKSLDFFDRSSFAQIKSLLFCELGEIDIVSLGNNIKTIFNSILKCNLKDKLEILNYISEQYNKNYDEFLSLYLCQKLAKKNFKMVFTFSKGNITDVATLLSICLKKIIKSKNKTNLKYEEFLEVLGKYKYMKLNIIPIYKDFDSNNDLITLKDDIPKEILLLIDIFQKIKKLQFKIDNFNREIILGILLILLNYDWLFPYIFEIEFDFNYSGMNKEIQKIYLEKIYKIDIKKDFNFNEAKKEIENLESNILKKYSNLLDLTIIYTFFIDKFPFLNNLEINIPDNFKKMIEDNFNKQKIFSSVPHPLEIFCSLNNLKILKIEFNALDSFIFEKIFSLIQNNSNLKNLSLDFFPKDVNEESLNFLSNLLKISEESSNDLYLLKRKTNKLNNNYEDKNELTNILLNQLIENFENNIEKLFILLQTKKNLEELALIFNEPNLFEKEEEDYYLIFLKFIFNILSMINREKFTLKSFKLISKYFQFDNNKNKYIDDFLSGINLNEKNKNLINFELNFQNKKIKNISNLFSYNYEKLYLGSLDKVSLLNFITFYKSKNFIEKSQLQSLTLELNKNITSYEECKEELIQLFKSEHPKNINELSILCKFNINENDLGDLLVNGNGNSIKKYFFQIKGESSEKNKYEKIIYDKNIYYIDKNIRNKIDKYIGVIIKYKFYIRKNENIGKKLLKFLLPNNRIIVNINFI